MILYFLSLIFCLFSPPFSQHPMRPFPLHYFDRRNLGDFSKFFLKFSSFLLPFSKSHARIQLMNQLHMREWLSWWSTTLPRLGSRVRVPSRALKNRKKDIQKRISFFVMFKPAGGNVEASTPSRASQSERPPDVLRRLTLPAPFQCCASLNEELPDVLRQL